MPVFIHKTHAEESVLFRAIMVLWAWGFALAGTSFLFLWRGHLLDELPGTSTTFMPALLFLAIAGCFIELYQEVWKALKPGWETLCVRHHEGRPLS